MIRDFVESRSAESPYLHFLCRGTTVSESNIAGNRFVWADIPVVDLDRACEFYAAVSGFPVHQETFQEFRFAVLHHDSGNGGCLVIKPDEVRSDAGILIYLNVNGRIRDAVNQVVAHGGTVSQDVHSIGPHGCRAIIVDSEGNRLALHSESDQ